MTGSVDSDMFDCVQMNGDELRQAGLHEGSVTFGFITTHLFDWESFIEEELVQSELGEVSVPFGFIEYNLSCCLSTAEAELDHHVHGEGPGILSFSAVDLLIMIRPGGSRSGMISSLGSSGNILGHGLKMNIGDIII